MGKNSKSKRDAKRKAAAKASNQRNSAAELPLGSFAGDQAAFGLAPGLTGEDSSSLMLMSKWDTLNPADGHCPGPVIIHQDGAFECHGGACESAMAVWHEAHNGGTRHCPGGVTDLLNACPRCFEVASVSPVRLDLPRCMGTEIDHEDGEVTCTEGAACPGDSVIHVCGMSCSLTGPCARCDAT